jgi:hypothetical protein
MGRRWKWFLRTGDLAVDLVGQVAAIPGDPGRYERQTAEGFVPEVRVTSRCDGSIVYELPEPPETTREPPEAFPETRQGTGRYDRKPTNQRNRRRY